MQKSVSIFLTQTNFNKMMQGWLKTYKLLYQTFVQLLYNALTVDLKKKSEIVFSKSFH